MAHQRSSAVPLAWLYAGLIAYASLYPFGGWRLPGHEPLDFLLLPWPRYWTGFDLAANLLGYLPLGALLFGAVVRGGGRASAGLAVAVAGSAGLSFAVYTAANLVPRALAHHRWYRATFPDYPPARRALPLGLVGATEPRHLARLAPVGPRHP